MRLILTILIAGAFLTVLVPAPAGAAACVSAGPAAPPLIATASVGTSVDCLSVRVAYCVLQANPDYPSHPYWTCRNVVYIP